MIELSHFDHIVLTVRDIAATCHFYTHVLGMSSETANDNRVSLKFGHQKINLHAAQEPSPPCAANPAPGTADFCIISKTPMQQMLHHLAACNVRVESGPLPRTGANGPIRSIYVRDPDNNLVEISIPGK